MPSAWEGEKRSYSTLGNTPFKKDFSLLNVKAEEAKKDLQKRSYSITEVRKIALIKKITNDLKEGKTSLLENESVLQRFGKFMSPKSTQKFIDESHDLAEMKKKFIDAAKIKGIYVPIDAAEAVRLAHTNYVKDYGGISSVQGNLSDVKNMLEKHKSFFPMIERALVEEKIALEKGRPVLYHGLSKIHYKFMYFLTKIMELAGLSYPGFLRIRGLSTYADPEKRLWLNNESFKRREFLRLGTKNDTAIRDRYHLLSTTNSLFTNITEYLEGPIDIIRRDSGADEKLSIEERFKRFKERLKNFCKIYQLEDYYPKIEVMFENLNIKSEGGILLQFIFDQNLFNKVVYACYPYGIQAEGSSDKVKNILDVQKLSDKELRSLQFRMILTEDCLLNPQAPEVQKGFKAIADCQNPAALYDFKQEANEEFEKLKEEIEQDKKNALKKKREQRTRTWGEYFRSFFARGDRGS